MKLVYNMSLLIAQYQLTVWVPVEFFLTFLDELVYFLNLVFDQLELDFSAVSLHLVVPGRIIGETFTFTTYTITKGKDRTFY